MKEFITTCVIVVGFLIGGHFGGLFGSTIGGVIAFTAVLFVSEKIESTRASTGFWLRYRGALIVFLSSIGCIIVGRAVLGDLLGTIGGVFAGQFVGEAIAEKLGWGGSALQAQFEFRHAYVAVLASAANADGRVSENEHQLILTITKELFSSLGYGDNADARPLVDAAITNPVSPHDVGAYVNALNPDFQHYVVLDMCKVLFADGEMSPAEIEWFTQFQQTAKLSDLSSLKRFSRLHILADDRRKVYLEELGLAQNATAVEIRAAYKHLTLKYHPDRQESMPQHARELIVKKMVVLNEAYAFLTNKGNTAVLHFKGCDGNTCTPAADSNFDCLCWLCEQRLRVPEIADQNSVRCPKCHSLAGLTFDPNLSGY